MKFISTSLFFLLLAVSACGGAAPPAVDSLTDGDAEAIAAAPSAVLAVALEGDVESVSETEYRAIGPEIRCSAFLLKDEEASPIAGLVVWKTKPEGAGIFSTGAVGVFFIPERTGAIEIVAEYDHEGATLRSPALLLHVSKAN